MKNLLAIFVILLISFSNATNANLKKEASKEAKATTEIEKLQAKQVGGLPTYSKTPFQLYIDKSIHGEMQSPNRLFYFRKDLSKLIAKTQSYMYLPYIGRKNIYKNQNDLFRTTVYIPTQMARIEVELFINHFNYNIYAGQKYNFSMNIYMGSTQIGTTNFSGNNVYHFYAHKSLFVNGEIFNVPAGNYDFWAKFETHTNSTGYFSYKFRNAAITTRNEYNYRTYFDKMDIGHLEITGYPLA